MPKFHRGFVLPLVITIIAVLAIGGVVYFADHKKAEAPIVTPVIDTSNWKTYKNEKYGFEFKYPESWVIKINDDLSKRNPGGLYFSVYDLNSQRMIGLSAPIREIGYEVLRETSSESYKINDINVVKSILVDVDDVDSIAVHIMWNMDNWEKSGELWFHYRSNESSKKKIIDEITSTLKFTRIIPPSNTEPIACTMDAMMCPDGTYVGRSGPKCEFVCPELKNNSPIILSVKTDKLTYGQDERINMTLTADNSSSKSITLYFLSGCKTSYSIGSFKSWEGIPCTAYIPQVTIDPKSSFAWTMVHNPERYKLMVGQQKINVYLDATSRNPFTGEKLDYELPVMPAVANINVISK